jgi:hypothetical protein
MSIYSYSEGSHSRVVIRIDALVHESQLEVRSFNTTFCIEKRNLVEELKM